MPTNGSHLPEVEGDLREALLDAIDRRPLAALGIGAGAGFLVGGGLRSRLGVTAMLFAGRMMARELMLNAMTRSIGSHGRRNNKTSGTARRGRTGSSEQPLRDEPKGRSSKHPGSR